MGGFDKAGVEERWRALHQAAGEADGQPVLTICGPSGSGKTSIARGLSAGHQVFIETTEGNPYLKDLLAGTGKFDAFGNQKWFVGQLAEYIGQASPSAPLVLDQDPAAVVLAYSRMFLDDRLISPREYERLIEELLDVERMLKRWRAPRRVMCLEVAAPLLCERVRKRSSTPAPPLDWFERVGCYFGELCGHFPGGMRFPGRGATLGELIGSANQLLLGAASPA